MQGPLSTSGRGKAFVSQDYCKLLSGVMMLRRFVDWLGLGKERLGMEKARGDLA